MKIMTEVAVRPFMLSDETLTTILGRIDRMRFYEVLQAVNMLVETGDAEFGVRPDIVFLLEELRKLARRLPKSARRDKFIEWTVWPCNTAYSAHLTGGGEEFRWI